MGWSLNVLSGRCLSCGSLGRSRFLGPFVLSMEEAVDAAVPMPWTVAYVLDAPVEREDPPLPGLDDRDGFTYAFPDGLPWREEGRGLQLLVSLARRLHGVVRTAGSLELIQPDPARAVDYRVHAPCWLEPDVLLGVDVERPDRARRGRRGSRLCCGLGRCGLGGDDLIGSLGGISLRKCGRNVRQGNHQHQSHSHNDLLLHGISFVSRPHSLRRRTPRASQIKPGVCTATSHRI